MIKMCISVTSHALDPLSLCHKLSHLLEPLPLERDVLYGRPQFTEILRLKNLSSITKLLLNYIIVLRFVSWN